MANLPQEYELAQLVRNVGNPHSSWNTPTPACEWDGVICNKANETTVINWNGFSNKSYKQLTGSLNFGYLPKTVHKFHVFITKVSGEVPLNVLSCKLVSLGLRDNELSGPLDLTALPPNMRDLDLSANRFTGEICLTELPSDLQYLSLDRNQLSGKVCLRDLPNLCRLRLYTNRFSGKIDVRSLPSTLHQLDLSNNVKLHGEIEKRLLPDKVGFYLNIRNTKIALVSP